ncbi:MAG: hypothetical protein WCO26_25900, partial [Deltaproteobacteria bacterium]
MQTKLQNDKIQRSRLDPESSNGLKILDSGLRRNDDRETEMELFQRSRSGNRKRVWFVHEFIAWFVG